MLKGVVRFLPFVVMATLAVFVATEPALAQISLSERKLGIGLFAPTSDLGFIGVLLQVLNFFLFLAGLVAFFYILYGGFLYLTAGGDAAKAGQGRQYIVNAIIGVIIIFASFALANFVTGLTRRNSENAIGNYST